MSSSPSSKGRHFSQNTESSRQVLAMVRISNSILQSPSLNDIFASVTRELSLLIDFDRSDIALFIPERNQLILRYVYRGDDDSVKLGENREIPMDDSNVIGWVAKRLQPSFRNDIEADKTFLEMVGEENMKSDMVVPLVASGKFLGTLNIGSHRKNAFTRTDLEIAENFGKLVCIAVEHSTLLNEARELGERYRTLQRSASDIIVLVNPNTGKLSEFNHQAERSLGLCAGDLNIKSFFDLFAEEDQYQARRDFINILSRKSMNFVDRRMVSSDGRIIYVDINANLVQLDKTVSIQVIIHDISQRKMMEQQIIRQNKNLQDINKKLREVDEMKTEFLARISHELRTPLSIILAYSESLKSEDLSTRTRREFLEVVEEQGQKLLDLINNLLDLSNLEISVTMLKISLSHLHDVIRSIWPKMMKEATRKNIEIRFSPGENIPVIYFDNKRILQVLNCLISNAVKFTGEGGRIEVRTRRVDEAVWVEVEDTGEGIPQDNIASVFETFHQVDGSISRRWGGLGIGLAMARHILELHGGNIWVKSELGKGSTFTFSLPLDTVSEYLPDIYRCEKGVPVDNRWETGDQPPTPARPQPDETGVPAASGERPITVKSGE
jgi:PAS domain S-box-containing protein